MMLTLLEPDLSTWQIMIGEPEASPFISSDRTTHHKDYTICSSFAACKRCVYYVQQKNQMMGEHKTKVTVEYEIN